MVDTGVRVYGHPMGLRLSSAAGRWALLATVLGSGLSGLQWTVTGYTLALAALILLGGALGDRYGRRRVFLIGVAWFATASLLCAVAPAAGFLIAARILQGVGGALLTPGSLALIQASFEPDDRARTIGAWSGLGGVAAAIGPFLGGWLVEGPGWRWAFLLNLPLAVVVILVTIRHVPESRDDQATGRFDALGAVLGALALAFITFALIGKSWISAGLGVVVAFAFIMGERRSANPMLPLSVFSSRQFTAVNVVTAVVYAALGGVFFLLALQLQIGAGFSPIAAGAALLPVTILMLLLSSRAGALAQRIGPRWPMTVGVLIAGLGTALMARIGPGSSYLVDVRPGAVADRGPADRDRPRLGRRPPGRDRERRQQRGRPGGAAARGRRTARTGGAWRIGLPGRGGVHGRVPYRDVRVRRRVAGRVAAEPGHGPR
jgi:EmrB/QacA subfamily drug resistance transporter